MKRKTALANLAALAVALPLRARAQDATPTPDPHTYNDDAMALVVPLEFQLVRRSAGVSPNNPADSPITVATWITRTPRVYQIALSMVTYSGDLDGYNTQYENQMRSSIDGLMVHHSERVSLRNGMPAFWIEMGYGGDFHLVRQYSLIWADRLRGVVLSYAGQLDQVNGTIARSALSNVSAVAYPVNR